MEGAESEIEHFFEINQIYFHVYTEPVEIYFTLGQQAILTSNLYDPQNLNRYSFESNNPQKNTDPSGHCPLCLVVGTAAVIGGVWNTINYYQTSANPYPAGAAGYFVAGAISGASSIFGPGASAGGAVAGSVIERIVDDQSLVSVDAAKEYTTAGSVAAITEGLGKFLFPESKYWLLKNPLSLGSTTTGQNFLFGQVTGNGLFSSLYNLVNGASYYNYYGPSQTQTPTVPTSHSGSGYSSSAGGYITSSGGFYPTNNPNWVPHGNTNNDYSHCHAVGNARCG